MSLAELVELACLRVVAGGASRPSGFAPTPELFDFDFDFFPFEVGLGGGGGALVAERVGLCVSPVAPCEAAGSPGLSAVLVSVAGADILISAPSWSMRVTSTIAVYRKMLHASEIYCQTLQVNGRIRLRFNRKRVARGRDNRC